MCNHENDDPKKSTSHEHVANTHSTRSSGPVFQFRQGWVIEGRRTEDGSPSGRFLQIGTGQWCPQQYATVFPLRQTAVIYANEFGYSIGHNAAIVRYRDHE